MRLDRLADEDAEPEGRLAPKARPLTRAGSGPHPSGDMNPFDRDVMGFINSFAGRSWALDRCVVLLSQSDVLQGSAAIAVAWWAWFLPDPARDRRRRLVLAVFCGALLALVLCRLAALGLPFRDRPIHDASAQVVIAFGMSRGVLQGHSAFPSDHAALAFSLAAGMWFVSRFAGTLLLAQAALLICLPRVYLGLHYPTDILGGALLGIVAAWAVTRRSAATWIARPLLALEANRPGFFYPGFVILSIQIADMMREVRSIATVARFGWHALTRR